MWRNAAISNLGINEESINNLKQTVVCRNNWSLQQSECFFSREKQLRPSTLMRHSDSCKTVHAVDCNHNIKLNGAYLLFNVPNYPMSLIKKDADAARKEPNVDDCDGNCKKCALNTEMSKTLDAN